MEGDGASNTVTTSAAVSVRMRAMFRVTSASRCVGRGETRPGATQRDQQCGGTPPTAPAISSEVDGFLTHISTGVTVDLPGDEYLHVWEYICMAVGRSGGFRHPPVSRRSERCSAVPPACRRRPSLPGAPDVVDEQSQSTLGRRPCGVRPGGRRTGLGGGPGQHPAAVGQRPVRAVERRNPDLPPLRHRVAHARPVLRQRGDQPRHHPRRAGLHRDPDDRRLPGASEGRPGAAAGHQQDLHQRRWAVRSTATSTASSGW